LAENVPIGRGEDFRFLRPGAWSRDVAAWRRGVVIGRYFTLNFIQALRHSFRHSGTFHSGILQPPIMCQPPLQIIGRTSKFKRAKRGSGLNPVPDWFIFVYIC
jgi:hypothetical protein